MTNSLLSPAFLFRFSVPCRYYGQLDKGDSIALDETFVLRSFSDLDAQRRFADVRAAWNEHGVALDVNVAGKRQSLWCRQARMESSDGLHVWVDTRDAHNIHRASRFCHQFTFLPSGSERQPGQPAGAMIPINRARENPRPVDPAELRVRSTIRRDGYRLQVFLRTAVLTGYDPAEQSRLGFFYAVADRELGTQTFSVGAEFPYQEDPSLWGTLELVR